MEAVEDNKGALTPNPWISVWTKPRETIQRIVNYNPEYCVLLIVSLAGIADALNRASVKGLGDNVGIVTIFIFAIILGPIFGVIGLYIAAWLIKVTGKGLGGEGRSEYIRASLAWSSVPIVVGLILWVPELWIFGEELFSSYMPSIMFNDTLYYSFMGFMAVEATLGIWSLVLLVKCIAQVQGFSAWKALGNLLLALLVVVLVIVLLVFLVMVIANL